MLNSMSKNLTRFIQGACFGFFDDSFKECKKCKLSKICEKATKGDKALFYRRTFKTNANILKELIKEVKKN